MCGEQLIFCSLGLFIIDEIHFSNGRSLFDVLGGGGTFAIVGSRIVLGNRYSKRCGWVVDIGNDCLQVIEEKLKSWNTGGVYRYHRNRTCNHGWNKYGTNEFRQFHFTNKPIFITLTDILTHRQLLYSRSFHFISSPDHCLTVLRKLDEVRGKEDKPFIVWEPDPDDCTQNMLSECVPVLREIDVLSPNAAECASFLGMSEPRDTRGCEAVANRFLPYMTKTLYSAIVLRCGEMGSLLMTHKQIKWFPPYYINQNKVVDPTGCGNTFVGAFTTGYVLSKGNLSAACICGTLASGISIETHGAPTLSKGSMDELWNGLSFKNRARIYLQDNKKLSITYSEFISLIQVDNI